MKCKKIQNKESDMVVREGILMTDIHLIQARERERIIHQEMQKKIIEIFRHFGENTEPELIFVCLDEDGIHSIPEDYCFKNEIVEYLTDVKGNPKSSFTLMNIKNSIFFSTGSCVQDQLDNIFPIVRVDSKVLDGQVELTVNNNKFGSFLEEIIYECLDKCVKILLSNESPYIYYKNIIRDSAHSIIAKVLKYYNFPVKAYEFIEDCNSISTMRYEGSVSIGNLLLLNNNVKLEGNAIQFKAEIFLKNYRLVRKLLEMTRQRIGLITDGIHICGMTEISEDILENGILVKFTDYFEYNVLVSGKAILKFKDNFPSIIKHEFNDELLVSAIKRVFTDINDVNIANLVNIIGVARKQKHGTMVVLSNEADNEAKRLSVQSTLITPRIINGNWMECLTSIDGAIIIDERSICYAVGVILDGQAGNIGNPTRGARYNSALKYHHEHKKECVIIVISEDGMVDIVSI